MIDVCDGVNLAAAETIYYQRNVFVCCVVCIQIADDAADRAVVGSALCRYFSCVIAIPEQQRLFRRNTFRFDTSADTAHVETAGYVGGVFAPRNAQLIRCARSVSDDARNAVCAFSLHCRVVIAFCYGKYFVAHESADDAADSRITACRDDSVVIASRHGDAVCVADYAADIFLRVDTARIGAVLDFACAYLADDASHVVSTFDHTVIRTILYCTIIGISDDTARFALTVYFCVVGATADIYCLTAVVSDDTAKTVRTVVCVIDFRIVYTAAYSHAERAVAVHAAYDSAHSRTFGSVVAVEVDLRTT